jgi:hypothetical protein
MVLKRPYLHGNAQQRSGRIEPRGLPRLQLGPGDELFSLEHALGQTTRDRRR